MASAYDNMINRRAFSGSTGTTPTRGTGGSSTPTQNTLPAPYSTPFQQNPFLSQQLNSFGGVPSWMMQAYAKKIGQMGGNANNPPFPITPGGFTGQASSMPSAGGKVNLPSSITNPGQTS